MAISNKKIYSPFVTHHTGATSYSKVSDVIVQSIQVTSDTATDDATIALLPLGGVSKNYKISSGDTVYGPFTSYEITNTTDAAVSVIVHEREFTTTLADKTAAHGDVTSTGDTEIQISIPNRATCSTDLKDITIQLTDSDIDESTTANDALLDFNSFASITEDGLLTVNSGIIGTSWTGTINYKIYE